MLAVRRFSPTSRCFVQIARRPSAANPLWSTEGQFLIADSCAKRMSHQRSYVKCPPTVSESCCPNNAAVEPVGRRRQIYRNVIESNEYAIAKEYAQWAIVQAGHFLRLTAEWMVPFGIMIWRQSVAWYRQHGVVLLRNVFQLAVRTGTLALNEAIVLVRTYGPGYAEAVKRTIVSARANAPLYVESSKQMGYRVGCRLSEMTSAGTEATRQMGARVGGRLREITSAGTERANMWWRNLKEKGRKLVGRKRD